MIGSLIVALPLAHQGGLLVIRHDGRKVEIDFSDEVHSREFQYVAFFANCEHGVQPVPLRDVFSSFSGAPARWEP